MGNPTSRKFRNGRGEFYLVGSRRGTWGIDTLTSKDCQLLTPDFSLNPCEKADTRTWTGQALLGMNRNEYLPDSGVPKGLAFSNSRTAFKYAEHPGSARGRSKSLTTSLGGQSPHELSLGVRTHLHVPAQALGGVLPHT